MTPKRKPDAATPSKALLALQARQTRLLWLVRTVIVKSYQGRYRTEYECMIFQGLTEEYKHQARTFADAIMGAIAKADAHWKDKKP